MITRRDLAKKIIDYLYGRISLDELVDWAERCLMEEDFEESYFDLIRDILSYIGLSNVPAFGLAWEDCKNFLEKLGYGVQIEIYEKVGNE
uniref:Uncharacterized protein n=1 Tax=Dictyoglomus thermophilum TaxID=14 RepID=A0A7C3RIZ2_DICTH